MLRSGGYGRLAPGAFLPCDRGMSAHKVRPDDYIQFVLATPRAYSATEAVRVQPERDNPPARDAFARLLTRPEPDPDAVWAEAAPRADRRGGVLVLDDATLDKPYARAIALVTRHWPGKRHAVVRGINPVTLLWTDGGRHAPCDDRVSDKADGLTKNDHFADMIRTAYARGVTPEGVAFDGWYAGRENLEPVRHCGWPWPTRLEANRRASPSRQGLRPLKDVAVPPAGAEVWLEGYGLVKVFGIVTPDGGTESWATGDLGMTALDRRQLAEFAWAIESYHRGAKQGAGIERCRCRSARAQRNHIGLALRAFLRLESHCFAEGVSWVEAKVAIVRDAVRAYLAKPHIVFPNHATA